MLELIRHSYKYYPYELDLARREVEALLPNLQMSETKNGFLVQNRFNLDIVKRFVYYAGAYDGNKYIPTMQAKLECSNGQSQNRQSTRYSTHGMHEYKGKFNPQIVRAILNILGIPLGSRVIDPFCGSGTSLLECLHIGMNAIGTDINPLAVYIANAKLAAAKLSVDHLRDDYSKIIKSVTNLKQRKIKQNDNRDDYMLSWFTPEIYQGIENLRLAIEGSGAMHATLFLSVASNLLREYSLQDPKDLRIRKRRTPLPNKPFIVAYQESMEKMIEKIEHAKQSMEIQDWQCEAILTDSRELTTGSIRCRKKFDCAITSPPYATALPYIDTQRLSLIWLGLVQPSDILPLESMLVGSREVRGPETKKMLMKDLLYNTANLPSEQAKYCLMLQKSIGDKDGFRRQAVPILLYRYFSAMSKVFSSLKPLMKSSAPYALIVGSNHTVLDGKRFDINTPFHLERIAEASGWRHKETIPLQTYRRYGYHSGNAINAESLILLEAA